MDNDNKTDNEAANEVVPEIAIPEGLKDVDQEKLAKVRAALLKIKENSEKTVSGSEAPPDVPAAPEGTTVSGPLEGKNVDWSEYDLEFSVKHLYPHAKFLMTEQGPRWVVRVDQFNSSERSFSDYGKKTNTGEARNLGEFLNDMLNGPDGWTVVTVLPASTGRAGVLLRRDGIIALPDPVQLKKTTEVEAPKDPELQVEEDAALAFMSNEGLTPEPQVEENESGEPRTFNTLEEQALVLNQRTEHDPGMLSSQVPDRAGAEKALAEIAKEVEQAPDFGDLP